MSDTQDDLFTRKIPVTNELHRDLLWKLRGVEEILETLENSASHLPGMVMAQALVMAEVAQQRMRLSSLVYREAAKAGVDIAGITSISTQYDSDGTFMVIQSEAAP